MSDESRKYWVLGIGTMVLVIFLLGLQYFAEQVAETARARRSQRATGALRPGEFPPVPARPLPEGAELIGWQPGGWTLTNWVNSAPLAWPALRGQVVVVWWWAVPDCGDCAGAAPVLNDLWRRYQAAGLLVVGIGEGEAPHDVAAAAQRFGLQFPVAADVGGTTLAQWWTANLREPKRGVLVTPRTSRWALLVVDRTGTVRQVHAGPVGAVGTLSAEVESLLAGPGVER